MKYIWGNIKMDYIRGNFYLLTYCALWNLFCYTGVVLAESPVFVTNPIGSAFSGTQPVTTMVQTHPQGVATGAPTLVSSPRPSILRKKPVNEGWVSFYSTACITVS